MQRHGAEPNELVEWPPIRHPQRLETVPRLRHYSTDCHENGFPHSHRELKCDDDDGKCHCRNHDSANVGTTHSAKKRSHRSQSMWNLSNCGCKNWKLAVEVHQKVQALGRSKHGENANLSARKSRFAAWVKSKQLSIHIFYILYIV